MTHSDRDEGDANDGVGWEEAERIESARYEEERLAERKLADTRRHDARDSRER